MDAVALIVGISWILTALLCIGLSIPLVRGTVKPNLLYGARFAQSFASEDDWYAINSYGGRQLIGWSVPLLVVGLISLFLPLQQQFALTLVLGFAPLVFILIPGCLTWRYARSRGAAA